MKVVLVANDRNPTDMMKAVAKELTARSHQALLIVGEKPGECRFGKSHNLLLEDADMVFTGMSSSLDLADPELEAICHAELRGIPYGLFSDAPGCFQRSWFQCFQLGVSFLAVLREDEVAEAQKLFPNALVKATGHPSREISLSPVSREEVLRKLALPADSRIILCSGSKDLAVNHDMLFAVSRAGTSEAPELRSCRILFCPHPGDKNDWGLYSRFQGVELVPPSTASTSEVLAVASVFVNALSTTVQDAAYRRIPVVTLLTETIREKRRILFGTDHIIEVDEGVTIPVHNIPEMIVALMAVLGSRSPKAEALRECQERCYPAPNPPGTAARTAVDLMEEVLRES